MDYTHEQSPLVVMPHKKGEKCSKQTIYVSLIFGAMAVIGAIIAVVVIFANHQRQSWHTMLKNRPNFAIKTEPEQMATLFYDSATKYLFSGGGSDINPTVTPRLYRSKDQGHTWEIVYNATPKHFSMYGMTKLNNGKILLLCSNDIIWSVDGGNTFQRDPRTFENLGFSVNYGGGILIISRIDGKFYKSTDDGANFTVHTYEDTTYEINMRSQTYNGCFFIGMGIQLPQTNEARIYRSCDNAMTFTQMFSQTEPKQNELIFFSIKAVSDKIILAGTGNIDKNIARIFRSEDNGLTWKMVLDTGLLSTAQRIIRSFYISKNGTVFAAVDCSYASSVSWADEPDVNKDSQVFVSKDLGLTWAPWQKTGTKRLYWLVEGDKRLFASTGEYGEVKAWF